jgi:hypothetical protein
MATRVVWGAGQVLILTVPLLIIGIGMGMLTAPLTGIVPPARPARLP